MLALQTVLAGDMVPIKQRAKAAQQLATYCGQLPTTPGLYGVYEPYLPHLVSVVVTPIKAARDVQENVVHLLKMLGAHNPRQFAQWCAMHVSVTPSSDPWHVDWCCGLSIAAEVRLPRSVNDQGVEVWNEHTFEFAELGAGLAMVLKLWRSLLDSSSDEVLVKAIVDALDVMLSHRSSVGPTVWSSLVTAKMQPHFVDMADVLIGWATSAATSESMRNSILSVLDRMQDLWTGNSVFCLQLLESFSNDIVTLYATPVLPTDDRVKLNFILVCSLMVARCVPTLALSASGTKPSPVARTLSFAGFTRTRSLSSFYLLRAAEYLISLAESQVGLTLRLSVGAITFLVSEAANLVTKRKAEQSEVIFVIESSSRIASMSLSEAPRSSVAPIDVPNAGHNLLRSDQGDNYCAAVERLLQLKCLGALTHLTKLTVTVMATFGFDGLQFILVRHKLAQEMQQMDAVAYWASCFVLACGYQVKPSENQVSRLSQGLRATIGWAVSNQGRHISGFIAASRMVCAAMSNGAFVSHEVAVELVSGALCILESNPDESKEVARIFDILCWVIAQLSSDYKLPGEEVMRLLARLRCVLVTEDDTLLQSCTKLISVLARLEASKTVQVELADITMGLIRDDNQALTEQVATIVLPYIEPWCLLKNATRDEASTEDALVWSSELAVSDFESVFELLSDQECSEFQWHEVCLDILSHSRTHALSPRRLNRLEEARKVVRECAMWTIQNRLRSHLGGPSSTFSGIERVLQVWAERRQSQEASSSISCAMIVEFVSALESYIMLASDPKFAKVEPDSEAFKIGAFFRANLAVCEDWLSKIRPLAVRISGSIHAIEEVRHHSIASVLSCWKELEAFLDHLSGDELDQPKRTHIVAAVAKLHSALFILGESSCDLRDVDSIKGFQVWVDVFSCRLQQYIPDDGNIYSQSCFSWLEALRLEAELNYEAAVVEYEKVLLQVFVTQKVPHEATVDDNAAFGLFGSVILGCIRRCGACCCLLQQWDQFDHLFLRLRQLTSRFSTIEDEHVVARFTKLCTSWNGLSRATELALPLVSDLPPGLATSPKLSDLTSLSGWEGCVDQVTPRNDESMLIHEAVQLKWSRFRLASYANRPVNCISKQEEHAIFRLYTGTGAALTHAKKPPSFDDVRGGDCIRTTTDAALWSRPVLDASFDQSRDGSVYTGTSIISLARLARKQNNVQLASLLLSRAQALGLSEEEELQLQYEQSLVMIRSNLQSEGLACLGQLCSSMLAPLSALTSESVSEAHLEGLLQLAKSVARVESGDEFVAIEQVLKHIDGNLSSTTHTPGQSELLSARDDLVLRCLRAATTLRPSSMKAWLSYSKWCHERGRQNIDAIISNGGRFELVSAEEEALCFILDQLQITEAARSDITAAFQVIMDKTNVVSGRSENLRRFLLSRVSEEDRGLIEQLVELQNKCLARVLDDIKRAAIGYRSFLFASQQSTSEVSTQSSQVTLTVLRLLRILTRFGAERELAEVAGEALIAGPMSPWTRIVPQLLSRIGHPEKIVSTSVAKLLKRLGRQWPHLVVYPAVVESRKGEKGELLTETASLLIKDVLDDLRRDSASLVNQVEQVVSELNRIAVLWDDLWLTTLMKMSTDVSRRISTLEKEELRVDKNSTLTESEKLQLARRKSTAIMKPVLMVIERLWNETIGRTKTGYDLSAHERTFLHVYGKQISSAMRGFHSYCNSDGEDGTKSAATTPLEVWSPFAELLKALIASAGRRERLDLAEISPVLHGITHGRSSGIMPGVVGNVDDPTPVTIKDIGRNVRVLRTKTKPKCLRLEGSNGKTYRYLLKAREDLHLDERMMQFHSIVNELLRSDRSSRDRGLAARHYGVIPLSTDAGLIQMVPDVVPLFQIFTTRAEEGHGGIAPAVRLDAEESVHPAPQPPTAAFYAKLRQYGVNDVTPNQRPHWPAPLLRRVYDDLVSARPKNIIYHEILSQCLDFAEVRQRISRFSRSLAVMSVVGFVIGLGDRHLDNILLCAHTGEVVHIDYNVCFDKGLRLKVPEIVPFRLTPMLVDALGITGVEGRFRTAFEQTLRVVRKGDSREALSTLLEAFVYDPLVDWIKGGKQAKKSDLVKKRLEVNVNLSLFLSRAEERRQLTIGFGEAFVSALSSLSTAIEGSSSSLAGAIPVYEQYDLSVRDQRSRLLAADDLGTKIEQALSRCGDESIYTRLNEVEARLEVFVKECLSRHEQIMQWRSFVMATQIPSSSLILKNARSQTFGRVFSDLRSMIESQHTAASTPGWETVQDELNTKCVAVDALIGSLIEDMAGLMHHMEPLFIAYSEYQRDVNELILHHSTSDVYGLWGKECALVLWLVRAGKLQEAVKLISRASSFSLARDLPQLYVDEFDTIEQALQREISCVEDQSVFIQQEPEVIDRLVQVLFGKPSAMKLSNSQSQRVMKLASAWCFVSLLDQCNSSEAPADFDESFKRLSDVAREVMLALDISATAKGSMKRMNAEHLLQVVDRNKQMNEPSKFIRVLCAYLAVLESVECLSSVLYKELLVKFYVLRIGRQIRGGEVRSLRHQSSHGGVLPAGSTEYHEIINALHELVDKIDDLQITVAQVGIDGGLGGCGDTWFEACLAHIESVMEEAETGRQSPPDRILHGINSQLGSLLVKTLQQPLVRIITHVMETEWNLQYTSGSSDDGIITKTIEDEALKILPSVAQSREDSLASFQQLCQLLNDVLVACAYRWHVDSRSTSLSRRFAFLHSMKNLQQKRVLFMQWNNEEAAPDQMNRHRTLDIIAHTTATKVRVVQTCHHLEAYALELAQQLEYSGSRTLGGEAISFSGRVQALYNSMTRLIEFARSVADTAQGIEAIESSTGQACRFDKNQASLEVDKVGSALFDDLSGLLQKIATLESSQTVKSFSSLKEELHSAQESVATVTAISRNRKAALERECSRYNEQIRQTTEQLLVASRKVLMLLSSFQQVKAVDAAELDSASIEGHQAHRTHAAVADAAAVSSGIWQSFSFSENQRLARILLRNVTGAPSLQELRSILMEYETLDGRLCDVVSKLVPALGDFVDSASSGLAASDYELCVAAFSRLVGCLCSSNVEGSSVSGDLVVAGQELMSKCIHVFYTAAVMADTLSKKAPAEGEATERNSTESHEGLDESSEGEDSSDHDEVAKELGESTGNDIRRVAQVQEANTLGLDVVRRIEQKLYGFVTESDESPLSVEEQSSWLINEATSADNLCVMYEGWTPWI
ncbi:hypothetical protein Poli38472_007872 [Pythium oligandrum]|uniref:non-specific serine/threonine protein kinase n=1 Tax=Pythium oligandrum TaxID=41045 RepID=A0A8K1CRH2_PYTOL|nr:hypothetical protein Poli38472_007872 [Pythium oligandrum]|eukprot:TMW68200.1 hypothetical protein Poli38472_007872 [Pythium oligandrum]